MSDVAEFPLPADVTAEERAQLRDGIGRYAKVVAEDPRAFRFEGEQVGQTGPVHHFQYLRLYRVANGFICVGHDLREGMRVTFAATAEELASAFEQETVREFIEDELRYRGVFTKGASSH